MGWAQAHPVVFCWKHHANAMNRAGSTGIYGRIAGQLNCVPGSPAIVPRLCPRSPICWANLGEPRSADSHCDMSSFEQTSGRRSSERNFDFYQAFFDFSYALYQGPALDGPPGSTMNLGFSPCCFCFAR